MLKKHILLIIGILNTILLLIILVSNICYAILKNEIAENYILYTAPLLILFLISIITMIIHSLAGYGILYLLASLFWAFLGFKNDVGSSFFFIISLSCFEKCKNNNRKITYPIVLSVFFFVVFLKFAVFNIFKTDMIIVTCFYLGAYGINYLINNISEGGKNGDKRNL